MPMRFQSLDLNKGDNYVDKHRPEQIAQWKTQTLTGFSTSEQQTSLNRKQQQADQKQIKQLKQEIKRKDKALAEAAAILILRKKLDTLWGEDEDK